MIGQQSGSTYKRKVSPDASLLVQILTATFADHLPLNRQEGIFKRHGVHLHRSTLCEYKLGAVARWRQRCTRWWPPAS